MESQRTSPKKNLIYFTLGHNPSYIELTKFCIHTLKMHSSSFDDGNTDLMVMCDEEYSHIVKKHLPFVKIHITSRNNSAVASSMRKVEIFRYANIDDYHNIMYLDSDIIILNDINKILREELEDDLIYVKKENSDVDKLRTLTFSLCAFSDADIQQFRERYQQPFNAGHFLFKNTPIIKSYFSDILNLMESWSGPYFYEQSFLNHYFQLNFKYNDTFLDEFISFYDGIYHTTPNPDSYIIHCFKSDLSWNVKLGNMKQVLFNMTLTRPVEIYDTRDHLPRAIPLSSGSVIAKIGVYKGEFSRKLYEGFEPSKLVLIEPFEGQITSGDKNGNNLETMEGEEAYNALCTEYKGNARVEIIRDYSTAMLNHEDNFYDLVYIDGDHSYECVKRDLLISFNKVKRHGWICGYAFDVNPEKTNNRFDFGVKRAVCEFCMEKGLKVDKLFLDGCISFAVQVHK